VESIAKETNYAKSEVWIIDLSSFASINAFAEKFEKDGGRLDILVMNAAIVTYSYEATVDGYESSLQVNHLGTSLLSLLLLPVLVKTANEAKTASRLVIVTSDMHYFADITKQEQAAASIIAKLNDKDYSTSSVMSVRYQVTKLLNIFFTRALNDHISPSTPVIVNCANPGFCPSELRRDMPFPIGTITSIAEKFLAYTTEQGSRQLVCAALGGKDDPDKMRGAFINLGAIQEVSDFVISEEGKNVQERTWHETIDILAGVTPKVRDIVNQYLAV